MQKYSEEIKEFIKHNVAGTTTKDLVILINDKFGTSLTEAQIRAFKKNHGLKSGTFRGKVPGYSDKYPKEVYEFILANVKGNTTQDLIDLINESFNVIYTHSQIRAYKKNHKLTSGVDSKFKKGSVPPNKGKFGTYSPGCEKGWFEKGKQPHNHKPVGSERIDSRDGYTLIKTAEPNKWELKHKVMYEETFGKIPEGHIVTFLDGDKTNITIDNFQAISMAESLTLTRSNLRFKSAELTKTGILIAKLKRAKFDKRKQVNK